MAALNTQYDYSTLETALTSDLEHGTLELCHRPPSTFEGKEAYTKIDTNPGDIEASTQHGRFWNQRVCGIRMKVIVIAAIVCLLAVVGAVLGGVLGTRKKDNGTQPTEPTTPDVPNNGTSNTNTTVEVNGTTILVPNPLFASSKWHTIELEYPGPQGNYSIAASYKPDILDGEPVIRESLRQEQNDASWHSQQWQFYPVPATWANSTVVFPVSQDRANITKARTFWIANRHYGPDVHLALYDDEARWTNVAAGKNTSTVYPYLRLRPMDLSNPAQYWFAVKYACGTTASCFKFHNVKSGIEFRIWANERAKDENGNDKAWRKPLMGTGVVGDSVGAWDAWNVYFWEDVVVDDGGFEWAAA